MDETQIGILVGLAGLGIVCICAMIREVLLKKERDKWHRQFDRRNRKEDEWYL